MKIKTLLVVVALTFLIESNGAIAADPALQSKKGMLQVVVSVGQGVPFKDINGKSLQTASQVKVEAVIQKMGKKDIVLISLTRHDAMQSGVMSSQLELSYGDVFFIATRYSRIIKCSIESIQGPRVRMEYSLMQ